MSRFPLLLVALMGWIACQNGNPSASASGEKKETPPAMPSPSAAAVTEPPPSLPSATPVENRLCYLYASATDTIRLNIALSGANATGDLMYRLNGKDASTGELRGMVQGDVLYGQYTFQAEGKTSIREVAFKLTVNEAREGYGELWEIGGRTIFKNRNGLQFENTMILKAVACP